MKYGSRIDISPYESLEKTLRENPRTVLIKEGGGDRTEESLVRMGSGCSKTAYQCERSGMALILPNMDTCQVLSGITSKIASYCGRVVDEEVQMSKTLMRAGLLSLGMRKVYVCPSDNEMVPAYLAESFPSLAEKGIYVIDTKNDKSTTWRKKFFGSPAEACDPNSWRTVCQALLDDVAKLVLHEIPVTGDSINFAVIEHDGQYQVRFLGFDFTNKCRAIDIPSLQSNGCCQRTNRLAKYFFQSLGNMTGIRTQASIVRKIVDQALIDVFYFKFRDENNYGMDFVLPENAKRIKDRLATEFTMKIMGKIAYEIVAGERPVR